MPDVSAEQAFDERQLRDALGRFATGVTIVTALAADGAPLGMTVNSFAAVSLQPPLVLWSLSRAAPRHADWLACEHFAIAVLGAEQIELSNRFADPAGEATRFDGLDWRPGAGGVPLLPGMRATFECAGEVRHDGGDHTILIGRVLRLLAAASPPAPLLFIDGGYAGVQPLRAG